MNKVMKQTALLLREILEEKAEEVKNKEGVTDAEIVRVAIGYPYYKQNKVHTVGEICRDRETEQLKKCIVEYDGSVQTEWTIEDGTLWYSFHGINEMTAYPYAAPTGAHDMYKAGEYMTYTDGQIYKAVKDTAYSPEDVPGDWELV